MTAITSGSIVDGAANEQKKKTEVRHPPTLTRVDVAQCPDADCLHLQADEILEKVYSNMAACHLKQSNWKRAIETADKVRERGNDRMQPGAAS